MKTGVLLVGTEDGALAEASAILAELGLWQLLRAPTHQEAARLLRANNGAIGAMLVDLTLRPEEGVLTCARLKTEPAAEDVPILAIARSDQDDALGKATLGGVSDFIAAPPHRTKVAARIRSALRLRTEIARRREQEALAGRPSHEVEIRPCETALLPSRASFEAAMAALAPDCVRRCGLIVIRHTGAQRNRAELTEAGHRALAVLFADAIAAVTMPAGELLASLGDDLYVHAALAVDAAGLEERAERYRAAVAQVRQPGLPSDALQVDITTVPAGRFATIAEALAQGVMASDPGRDGRRKA